MCSLKGFFSLVIISSLRVFMQQDVFSARVSKLENILLFEFHVPFRFYFLIVDIGTVGGFEVDDVRYHTADCPATHLSLNSPVLEGRVLTATGGMVNGDIGDLPVFADEVGRLTVEMHDGQALLSLEDVKPPPLFRLPSLGGLAVLDHHAIEDVGVAHQGPRQAHLNLRVLFLFGFRFTRLDPIGASGKF